MCFSSLLTRWGKCAFDVEMIAKGGNQVNTKMCQNDLPFLAIHGGVLIPALMNGSEFWM